MIDKLDLNNEQDSQIYSALLTTLTENHPYYTTKFIRTFGSNLKNGIVLKYENVKNGALILMPGYLRPIEFGKIISGYYDFMSPYGYSGPIYNANVVDEDKTRFWKEVDKFYAERNVICEFIRFDLNENHLLYTGDIVPTLLNIKGKLIEKDEQWKKYEHKVRKNVKKAEKAELHSKIFFEKKESKQVEEFYEIYMHTLIRNDAKNDFYYSLDQFKNFVENNNTCAIVLTYKNTTVISAELILVSNSCIYSFLGGTLSNYFDLRPNDLLKHNIINWGRERGYKYFVLGGGYGADDGIFRYKKSFFPEDVVHYYTGRKVLNNSAYKELINYCNEERISRGLSEIGPEEGFFPLYRKIT